MTSARRPRSGRWGNSSQQSLIDDEEEQEYYTTLLNDHENGNASYNFEEQSIRKPASARTVGGKKRRNKSTPTTITSPSTGSNLYNHIGSATKNNKPQRSASNPDTDQVTKARERMQQTRGGGGGDSPNSASGDLSNHFRSLPVTASGNVMETGLYSGGASVMSGDPSILSSTSALRSKQPQPQQSSSAAAGTRTPSRTRRSLVATASATSSLAPRRAARGNASLSALDTIGSITGPTTTTTTWTSRTSRSTDDASVASRRSTYSRRTGSGTRRESSSGNKREKSRDDRDRRNGDSRSRQSGSRSRSQSRSRRKSSSSGGGGGGRSRSHSQSKRSKSRTRSKSAKRRSGAGGRKSSNSNNHEDDASAVSKTRGSSRRRPSSSNNLSASATSLDANTTPKTPRPPKQQPPRNTVGPGLPPATRSVVRSKSSQEELLGASSTRQKQPALRTRSPTRGVMRSKSSSVSSSSSSSFQPPPKQLARASVNTSNLSNSSNVGLASFLQEAGQKKSNKKSSGRSVSSMPIPKSELSVAGGSVASKMKKRGKKNGRISAHHRSTGELSFDELETRRHHGSFTSGLDFLTASTSKSSKPGKKDKKKMNSSLGSGLDFLTAMAEELEPLDNLKKKGRRQSKKKKQTDDDSREPSLHISDLLGEEVELDDEDEDSSCSGDGGGSQCTMGTIADRRKQFEQELKLSGMTESEAFQGDIDEDIFTFYTWSSSQQPRPKILRERKLLQEAIQHAAVIETKDSFIGTTK